MSNNNINFKINYQKGDTSALDSLKRELNELKSLANNLDMGFSLTEINQLLPAVSTLEKALDKAFDVNLNTINIQKFNQILAQSGMNAKTLQQGLSVAGTAGDQAFLHLTSQLMKFNTATKQTNAFLDSIANSFFNTIKYTAFNAVLNNISGTIQRAAGYVKSLDSSLNDIRIVTGKSADEMERFAEQANEAAKQLAVTTSDYTEGSLIYYQQGLDDETVKTLTDITAMTSNVTGQSMEVVSEQLTAVWNGYQVANQAAEEGMQVYEQYVDKMAAVGATTASDLQELATAMSKVASAASSMGVSFDDLAAQIATIVSVTRQAPESVGTALKTIYARLGDLKVDGVDEFGTKLGEVSAQLQTMGINILDTNGNMRDMSSVMTEVAAKWNTWTSAQRQAAAVAMAGKRQYNNLVALFDNWDMYGEALETSMNAAGTLEKQQEIALDSLANKMDILKATAEDLYDSLVNEDALKTGIESLTSIIQLLADFSDSIGGLNNLFPLLGATVLRVFNQQIAEGLSTIIINARTAKTEVEVATQNAAELRALFADSTLYQVQNNNIVDQARLNSLKELEQYYNKMQQYQSIMSQQEKEQYNNILNMTEQAGRLNIELANQQTNWNQIAFNTKLFNQDLTSNEKNLVQINDEINKIASVAKEISNYADTLTDKTTTLRSNGKFATFGQYITDLGNDYKLTGTQIQTIIDKFNTLGNIPLKEKLERISEALKKVGLSATEITRLESEIARTTNTANTLSTALQNNLNTRQLISNITNTVGAIGQLASSFSMLQHTLDILNNNDLSIDKKLVQGLMNLGMSLPILMNSFKSFGALTDVNISKLKNLITVEEIENAKTEAAILTKNAYNASIEAQIATQNAQQLETEESIFAETMLEEAELKETLAQEAQNKADEANILLSRLQNQAKTEAIMTSKGFSLAKLKESIMIVTGKKAIEGENVALLTNLAIKNLVVAGVLAVTAVTLTLIKIREKQIEQQIELNKKTIESNKAKEEEVKTNKELVKSYKELLAQQEKGEKVQESLYQKAMEVARAYDIQGASILTTKGYYQELTEQIKQAQLEESKINAVRAKESAAKVGENAIKAASGGIKSGIVDSKEVTYTAAPLIKGSPYIFGPTFEDETAEIAKKIGLGTGYTWSIDFTDPEAVKKYTEQIDYMVQYTKESGDKSALIFFQKLQKEMSEYLPELEEQLELFYTETVNIAFGAIDLTATNSAIELAHKINEIRKQLIDSGKIPEKEVDKYIDKYLSGINSIQENIDKINIAKQLSKQFSQTNKEAEEIFDGILTKLETFSDPELAYLSIHLNDKTLDKELQNWIDRHSDIISLLRERGASIGFKNTLSTYDEKTGFNTDTINTLFAEGSATADYLPEKSTFQMVDVADQYDLITQAMIKSTKEAVEHKDTVVDMLTTERRELELLQDEYDIDADIAEERIKSLTEGNESLKDDYEDIYQLAIKLADGTEELDGADAALLSKIETLQVANKDQLKKWGEQIVKANENQKSINKLSSEIDAANNSTIDYKNNIKELNTTLSLHSKVMDDIQTAYSNLTNMIDDYKETGHWTVDNVQKLIEMDDKYVATLEMENGTLQLNDEAFQKLALAKIEDMRVTILNTAYQKLLAIANKDVSDEALKAADAVVQSALAIAEAQGAAENAIPSLEALANKLAEIRGANGADSNYTKAAENVYKAAQNELAALDDVANQIGKGGTSMKKALHTGKSSKSGSSKDKDKELKKLDEEFDRYWEIHKALDQIDRDLKKIDKDQENLYGKELIRSLKQENELLANQSQLYEQLYAAQEAEAAELRGTLGNSGVIFDASGAVLNYAQATAAALKEYNDAITAYNNGLLDDAALKIHEQKFEQFKKDLERYDTLFYTEMQETLDKIDDLRRQTLANNLKAWEVEIQLKLDFKELERDWNDFINEVTEDFQKVFKDLRVEMKNMLKDAKTYIGSEGTIGTIIGAVKDVTREIDKMMGGGESGMFESVSQAQEKLKELNDELLDAGKALHDLWEEAWDNYLEGIDQVSDAFDKLIDRFERINDELEFQKNLIELLYGDEAYKLMSKYYEGQMNNTKVQMQSLKEQTDMWKELFFASGASMDNQLDWTEDQQKYYEQWMEAQGALNDLVLDYIKLLQNDYLNTVNDILKQLETALTGSSLKDINEEWERISNNAEKYYDSVEGAYYIQTLANKIDQSIADSNNLQAQQKLMELREREIGYLREKENLTEYDIKAAELRYQLALREIALEDAQNNKTGMKLTRNEQGNWSYQYVADEDDVASKRQELLDTYNELYQLASDAYEANLESLTDLLEEFKEKALEIAEDETLTEEQKQAKLDEIRTYYLEKYKLLAEENQLYRNDLATAGAGLLLEIYRTDEEAVQGMTERERELINTLVQANIDDYMELQDRLTENYQEIGDKAREVMEETRQDWTSGAQTIADLWNGDNGDSVRNQVLTAYDAINEATRKYQELVDECAEIVERDFSEEGIAGAIIRAEDETDALRDKTVEMVNTAIPYLQALRGYVDQIAAAWQSVQAEIMNTISLINEYLRKVGEANATAERQAQTSAQKTSPSTSKTPSNKETNKITPAPGVEKPGTGGIKPGAGHTIVHPENILVTYDTGGYTGQWSSNHSDLSSGRLAVLHQKELVLNADDTKNFLSAINTIRSLSSSVGGSIQDAVLKAVANTALSLGSIKTSGVSGVISNNNSSTDNVFNITAEFPNANNVNEIREAILSLPNLASQFVNSTLK